MRRLLLFLLLILCPAIVQARGIEPELVDARECLCCERFVELDQIDLAHG